MHRSLTLLRISDDEHELKSRLRLLHLSLSKNFVGLIGALCFFGFAAIAAVIGCEWTFVTPLQPAGGGPMELTDWLIFWVFVGACTIGFAFFGALFAWPIATDPILRWLAKPDEFVFARGHLVRAEYLPGERRSLSKMRVRIEAETDSAVAFFSEDFATNVWLFADADHDAQLKKGDDWFDVKGKRPRLPLPAYVLISKKTKASAALVGIPAVAVDRAMKIARDRAKRESRANWLLLVAILGTSALILVIRYWWIHR